jgi:hypothetical protein
MAPTLLKKMVSSRSLPVQVCLDLQTYKTESPLSAGFGSAVNRRDGGQTV